ncbi:hypothetical protein [Hymenobacter rubripertinctus]|uniref:Uncharacterized protein n=1 Tax=Hymenobacter rubripertinctus TaxID=2029981 RepID=A0A418QNX6_9BACT|nr:hypothetical protein [Hymenobacter rubripertinctus]RIY06879.1 hypothetical protein D0T11_17780 [Hymenobacter rubripertinctus]
MPTQTREQLIAAVEAVIRPGGPDSAKITANDVRTAFGILIDEVLARSTQESTTSVLEFVFATDFGEQVRATIGNRQAGSYRLAATQNTTSINFVVNGNPTAAPINVQSGDELTVTVTRQSTTSGAIVTLESLGNNIP